MGAIAGCRCLAGTGWYAAFPYALASSMLIFSGLVVFLMTPKYFYTLMKMSIEKREIQYFRIAVADIVCHDENFGSS